MGMKSTGELQREILQLKQALGRAPSSPENREDELAAAALRARIIVLQQELEKRRSELAVDAGWGGGLRRRAERPPAGLLRRLFGWVSR